MYVNFTSSLTVGSHIMHHPPERAEMILNKIQETLNKGGDPNFVLLRVTYTIMYLQNYVLASLLRPTIGDQVYSGPFKGMALTPDVMVGGFGPILLGTYEHELHEIIERITTHPYQNILNIGCGYGYYSVGMALRMPHVKVFGFDIDLKEQERSRQMATLNNVQDRVKIDGRFNGDDFEKFTQNETLLIMDIEGGEMDLLDPIRFPALKKMDILVELHDCIELGISTSIQKRFASTHRIEMVYNRPQLFDFSPFLGPAAYVDPFDSLAITHEHRSGATPWAYMRKL